MANVKFWSVPFGRASIVDDVISLTSPYETTKWLVCYADADDGEYNYILPVKHISGNDLEIDAKVLGGTELGTGAILYILYI